MSRTRPGFLTPDSQFSGVSGRLISIIRNGSLTIKLPLNLTRCPCAPAMRDFTPNFLAPMQKAHFDSIKAKEHQSRINSKALVEVGNLGTILDLTQEQKEAAHGVLFELAANNQDSEEPKGLTGIFIEGDGIETEDELGINSMMGERLKTLGDSAPNDDDKKIITETITKRILEKVEEMRPVLSPPQL